MKKKGYFRYCLSCQKHLSCNLCGNIEFILIKSETIYEKNNMLILPYFNVCLAGFCRRRYIVTAAGS